MKRSIILSLFLALASQMIASAAPQLSVDAVIRIADAELRKHQQDPNA